MLWQQTQLEYQNKMSFAANPSWQNVLQSSKKNQSFEENFECVVLITRDTYCYKTWHQHRFSAFWLRSKCSICSYQLNIWYEDHVSSSILNSFLQGDGMSGACSGSIKSWLCIAVPQRSAHFPTLNHAYLDELQIKTTYSALQSCTTVKTESLIGTLW